MSANQTPEQIARDAIDAQLRASGWAVQSKDAINLHECDGQAVREYSTASGPADYVLFVDGKPVGVIEAKKETLGHNITTAEEQSADYASAKLRYLQSTGLPLPFVYEATGVITRFTDQRDPKPRSREVFSFHRPETIRAWLAAPAPGLPARSLRTRLQDRAERAGDRRGVAVERGPAPGDPAKSLHRPPRPPGPVRRTRLRSPRPATHGAGIGRCDQRTVEQEQDREQASRSLRMSDDPASPKLRIFISSVQKELELERAAVAALIATDPFLLQHCVPVLFEQEPPPPRPSRKPYLDTLKSCQAYVLMIGNEYGGTTGELSATHEEYRLARKLDLPSVVFLKGRKDDTRSTEVGALIAEAKQDGFTYRRFNDRKDLEPEMQRALLRLLAEEFNLKATPAEAGEGQHLIEAASTFESAVLTDVPVEALDEKLLNRFNHETAANDVEQVWRTGAQALQSRGLAVRGPAGDVFHATMAAWLLFGGRPADRFPQCEILADAYDDTRISGKPRGKRRSMRPCHGYWSKRSNSWTTILFIHVAWSA